MAGVSAQSLARNWVHWEDAQRVLQLASGVQIKVDPGDMLLADINPETHEIVYILQHRKRTLH